MPTEEARTYTTKHGTQHTLSKNALTVEVTSTIKNVGALTDTIFENYTLQRLFIHDAKPHPATGGLGQVITRMTNRSRSDEAVRQIILVRSFVNVAVTSSPDPVRDDHYARPESVKAALSFMEYQWLSGAEKAHVVQGATEPEIPH